MGIHLKENFSTNQTPHKKIKSKMLTFTVFTVLASTAMLGEAAPGGGYYYRHHSHHNKMMAKAPAAVDTRTAAVGDVVDVAVGAGAFSTLVKIVSDLGLVDTLKGV